VSLYKYKYIINNEEKEETKEFEDKKSLYDFLHKEGGVLLSSEEVVAKKTFSFNIGMGKIKAQEKISFAKNLAIMIDAGLAVSRALTIMTKQTKNKALKTVLEDINASINRGESLSEALGEHTDIFSDLFVSMVRSGEESGTQAEALKNVAGQLEKANNLNKKILGAMIYPAIIVSLMVGIGFLMMVYMVPMLTETFVGLNVPLPLPTRVIIAVSDFLKNNLILVLVFASVMIGLVVSFFKSKRGKDFVDVVVLKIPVISQMTREVNSARTARTLSSLILSGVDIVNALKVTENVVQNHLYKKILADASKNVEKGEPVSSFFENSNGLYPIFMSEMISVGEETGKIADMFENVANFYEAEVEEKTKNLSTIIEPFLMILIGIAVGIFAIAMLAPTYSLVDVIGV
jgi:type IV pilus assembly protein PilC